MPLSRKDPASPSRDSCAGTAANDPVHAAAGSALAWQRFAVAHEFPVAFTTDLFAESNPLLADVLGRLEPGKRQRFLVFVDAGVLGADPGLSARIEAWAAAWAARVELVAAPVAVDAGEALKNDPEALEPLYERVLAHGIDRHSCVLGIGGGALLDAVGLVAATAHRGVRHVRVPTTVLAQNDSGVGVKNGVNRFGQKNWLGTFAPPFAVINDARFLRTLGARDRRAGMAEAVKVALIRDAEFFERLETDADALVAFEPAAVERLVRRCAELHMHQIGRGGDPFESGSARPLDFGHWAAHRLEALCGHRLRHGEAVAIGIALDARYSVLAGMLPEGDDERIAALLERLGFALHDEALDALDVQDAQGAQDGVGGHALLAGLEHFRTHLGGELTITLLSAIGVGVEVHEMDASLVLRAIDWLGARR